MRGRAWVDRGVLSAFMRGRAWVDGQAFSAGTCGREGAFSEGGLQASEIVIWAGTRGSALDTQPCVPAT
eukprot:362584-Chlamydomonas_euryale.AAC.6